ncbi:MAG: asparagine synthase (glutamine-hydrolyzing), partial [Candidatus Taylorbacteria bacterium RIFCSPLOWO2_12_FULL_49_67]
MCSINGFSWRDETLIKKMNAVTTHRGPDGSGTFVGSSVTLGHNRLSIIDLSDAGNQPMKSDDGRYVISFNGEIYNFRELKKELSSYPFKSQSDTEVILAAFSAWGESAFSRLNGMFAFALWDEKEKMLRLVRDPVGIKPLYYHIDGTRLIFASEIKAILKDAKVSRRINPLALDCYLRLNYVPAPLTMFRDIKKLLPGKILRHQNGKVELVHYATQKIPALSLESRNVLAAELLEKVHKSVEAQLVSDRPVGLYLSGGIDSSAILESMAHARGVVETFSVGFELREGEQAEKFNADFLLARRTAKYFGAKHHEVLLSPKEIIPLFEEAVYHLDEPISNA